MVAVVAAQISSRSQLHRLARMRNESRTFKLRWALLCFKFLLFLISRSSVGSLQSSVFSLQFAVFSLRSSVFSRQSSVGSLQSSVFSLQSSVDSFKSKIVNHYSTIKNQQSSIHNQKSSYLFSKSTTFSTWCVCGNISTGCTFVTLYNSSISCKSLACVALLQLT